MAVFVGDLVDRGPDSVGTVRLVMRMVEGGTALAVPGNHDLQLERHLAGDDIPLLYGLEDTAVEFARESEDFRESVIHFFQRLPGHLVLDAGRLVVSHAGLGTKLHGVDTPVSRRLAAYGEHSEDADPHDLSRRHAWLATYRGEAVVVYGHTPTSEAVWNGQTIDIDTGCVYGGRLTALRWPERVLVSVPARRVHALRRQPVVPADEADDGGRDRDTVPTHSAMSPAR